MSASIKKSVYYLGCYKYYCSNVKLSFSQDVVKQETRVFCRKVHSQTYILVNLYNWMKRHSLKVSSFRHLALEVTLISFLKVKSLVCRLPRHSVLLSLLHKKSPRTFFQMASHSIYLLNQSSGCNLKKLSLHYFAS